MSQKKNHDLKNPLEIIFWVSFSIYYRDYFAFT